jgi:predicted transcriptional regulator
MAPLNREADGAHRAALDTPISAVLSHGGVHVPLDTTIESLTLVLLQQRSATAAVTNDIGAVVGVISTADLLASLATAAALMAVEGSNALPIACSECESICVLSALDILSWLGRSDRPLASEVR